MDTKAFHKLSYGLYIITTRFEGRDAGCVVNTLGQVTSTPAQLSVAVNKENHTQQIIEKSGLFTGSVLTQEVDMDLIRRFGFSSSKDTDKFADIPCARDGRDIPYPTQGVAATFSCRVVSRLDAGSHMLFVGQVEDCQVLSGDEAMTYAYYHKVKNGVTPPKASSYQPPSEETGWRCTVCGYVHKEEQLPGDFICPICGKPASVFVKL